MIGDGICADCGKVISFNERSYYQRNPNDDIGHEYHSACGDPLGIKAKDNEIGRLKSELAAAIQARDLYHNQRDRAQMELQRALGSIRFCEHSGSRLDAPLPVPPIDLMNPEFE